MAKGSFHRVGTIVEFASNIDRLGTLPQMTQTERMPKGSENQKGGNSRQKRRSMKSTTAAARGPRMELGTTKPLIAKNADTPMRPKSTVSATCASHSPPEETVL